MYPLPAPSLSSSISLILPLSLRRNAFCFAAAFVQKVIHFSCCSLACYFTACRIGWGEKAGCHPIQLNNCHIPFASPCCTWKSFPYFVKRQIEKPTIEEMVCIRIVHNNKYNCFIVTLKAWRTSLLFRLLYEVIPVCCL